ncbi:MAG: hypothetical protein ACRD2L_15945, partial [Terriglobia bacterium]
GRIANIPSSLSCLAGYFGHFVARDSSKDLHLPLLPDTVMVSLMLLRRISLSGQEIAAKIDRP